MTHSHSHGDGGGWEQWRESARLRSILIALAGALIFAVIGIVAMWPTGEGRDAAIDAAREVGIATDRIEAEVLSSVNSECSYSTPEFPQQCRLLDLELRGGPDAGARLALPEINLQIERGLPQFEAGDVVVLGYLPTTNTYFYEDQARSTSLFVLAVLFAVIVVAFGRARGLFALLSMAVTVAIFVGFIAPSVLDGNDPVLVALVAATIIAFVSFFLTHGVTPTTTVALAGTLAALALTFVLSWIFFEWARFTGFGSSEALVLPFLAEDLRLSSLLLGGAIIGALGALDDVTVTQVSIVAELRHHNRELPSAGLIRSGLRIGRDHIAATVNTLLLAYAGASLPLLLLFAASEQSLASVANSEVIAVEIVRTLCGSIGLIAAVPLTTALAAAVLPPGENESFSSADPVGPAQPLEQEPQWDDFAPRDQQD